MQAESPTREEPRWGDDGADFIRAYFAQHASQWDPGDPLRTQADHLAAGGLDPYERLELPGVEEFEDHPAIRGAELELIIGFVREQLEHGVPPAVLGAAVTLLKRYFSVEEGEFLAYRPHELAALVGERLEAILEDGEIDSREDLEQVELQGYFDLSYDEYLTLARPAIERAVTELEQGTTSRFTSSAGERRLKLQILEPIYRLALGPAPNPEGAPLAG